MKVLGWMSALLAVGAAAAMVVAVSQILGPDDGFPPRGVMFDTLWKLYHAGPCLGLAVISGWVAARHPRRQMIGVTVAVAVIILPGLWVAWQEAGSRPASFSPLYGIATAATVAVQYVMALVVVAVVTLMWRRNRFGGGRPVS